jgi:hypothetical protein
MSVNGKRLSEFSLTEDLNPQTLLLNEARGEQCCFIDNRATCKALKVRNVNLCGTDRKRVIEAALRKATLHGRLTALKVSLSDISGATGLLTLLASTAGLTKTRTDTAPDSLGDLTGTVWRCKP